MASQEAVQAEGSAPGSSEHHRIVVSQRIKQRRRELQQQCLKPSGLDHASILGSRLEAWMFLLGITEEHVRNHDSSTQAHTVEEIDEPVAASGSGHVNQDSTSPPVPLDADGWQVANDTIVPGDGSSPHRSSEQKAQDDSLQPDDGWKVVKHKKSKRRRGAETASTPNSPDPSEPMHSSTDPTSGDASPSSTLAMSPDPSAVTHIQAEAEERRPVRTTREKAQTYQEQYPNLSSRDIEQVAKDVDRSFIGPAFKRLFSPHRDDPVDKNDATPLQDKALRRRQLTHLILTTLFHYPALAYFQGYHDIVAVVLLTLSPHRPSSASLLFPDDHLQAQIELAVERISLHLIRDSMTRDLLPIMGQLKILGTLLRVHDPPIAELVDRASPLPFFALPWLLTLLTHDVTDVAVMQRVLEFVLAYGPAAAIYLCAAVLLARKEEIEGMEEDELEDPAMLHTILGRLPLITADESEYADEMQAERPGAAENKSGTAKTTASPDSTAIYTDPDVELPSLASDRALAESRFVDEEPREAKSGIAISKLLQDAIDLMDRLPLSSDALETDKIMGPSSVIFTWSSTFDLPSPRTEITSSNEDVSSVDWHKVNIEAVSALTGATDKIVRDPHPAPPTPPASDLDEKSHDEKHPHRSRRLNLGEQTHQTRMLAVVGLSGLLVAALFTASQQSPVTTASQVVIGGTEETKRVLTLIVSLLSSWGRVVGNAS